MIEQNRVGFFYIIDLNKFRKLNYLALALFQIHMEAVTMAEALMVVSVAEFL